jgi:hypothetical protein
MTGPGSMSRYVAAKRIETHDALRAEVARKSNHQLIFDSFVAGVQSARNLALKCRRDAEACGPDEAGWREHYEAEAARHFDRARWYLARARDARRHLQ